MIRRLGAYILLLSIYGFTWLVAIASSLIPRRRWVPNGRILVTGTFFNPNWYLSHITPLARSGVREVILVVDEPQIGLECVKFACPPRWLAKGISRAAAKAIWMIWAGFRYRPDLYMGYHLAPGACSALLAGKLLGRPACYQATCGPVEFLGGGLEDIEGVGRLLGRPSRLVEKVALGVVNLFDLIVVRGSRAKAALTVLKVRPPVAVITGSVQRCELPVRSERGIDLVFVGRLAPVKQVDQFLDVVNAVSQALPSVRAAIVGDGPLMAEAQAAVCRLRLVGNVEFMGKRADVQSVLTRSKVFLLPSKTEGLSIAMAEAMMAGVVPVVADVGELGDLVSDGENGYLIEPDCIDAYAARVLSLLQDNALWAQFSRRANEAAAEHCNVEVVSRIWQRYLRDTVSQTARGRSQNLEYTGSPY